MATTLLIVTNTESLGAAIKRLAQRRMGESAIVFRLTYAECVSQLTQQFLRETSFFILELLREYPGGLRAEGITLAHRLAKRGKSCLVVSPLFMAGQLDCRMYWDASSMDALGDRIRQIIETDWISVAETERLLKVFSPLLALPPQHDL